MKRLSLGLLGLAMAMLLSVSMVSATTVIFDDTVSSCGTINCSSLTIPGSVFSFNNVSANPWVANLFAAPGECVRLEVTSQEADLEMVVVAPNGSVFRDDDGGTGTQPLVKIASAPNDGWYTVHLASFSGSAIGANFVLLYGRYTSGNANCDGATTPFGVTREGILDGQKQDLGSVSPGPDAPGFN